MPDIFICTRIQNHTKLRSVEETDGRFLSPAVPSLTAQGLSWINVAIIAIFKLICPLLLCFSVSGSENR
ncbi:hypothetical protein [Chroococcidiopsis sp. CCMEE 29]|uniref:hypothetical protein n=1 Tax=Chroococcidiopsis sp. CCMEE 29 TaxID=155894 RepID=UPI00202054E9|nr:hypothetical protein [Chroococcidiopsis sp. CCMEE 29]